MKGTRVLFRLVLLVGCGSLLTLLSGFYSREPQTLAVMDFWNEAPVEHRALQFGFPYPIFGYYIELWDDGYLDSGAVFWWLGALLDILLYAFIVGIVSWVGSEIARTIKARESQHV